MGLNTIRNSELKQITEFRRKFEILGFKYWANLQISYFDLYLSKNATTSWKMQLNLRDRRNTVIAEVKIWVVSVNIIHIGGLIQLNTWAYRYKTNINQLHATTSAQGIIDDLLSYTKRNSEKVTKQKKILDMWKDIECELSNRKMEIRRKGSDGTIGSGYS